MPSLITCLVGLACNGICYACNGRYTMDNVEIPRLSNLWLYIICATKYRIQLAGELIKHRIVRFNDSGDLPDYNYLEMIIQTAIETECNIHLFTKKHFLVNQYCKKHNETRESLEEKGIYILFSLDPKITNVVNPYGFRLAGIIEDGIDGTRIDNKYICNHGHCLACFIEKKGCFDKTIKRVDMTVHTASAKAENEYFNS